MFFTFPLSKIYGLTHRSILITALLALTACGFPEAEDAPVINEFVPSFESNKPVLVIAGDRQVTLTWPSHADATGYVLYWSTQADFTLATAESIQLTTPNYSHLGLQNGTTYFYAVGIDSTLGLSLPSGVSAATPDLPQLPAPTNVKVYLGDSRNTLYWDPVDGASSYSVYWSNNATVGLDDNRIDFVFSPFVHEGRKNGRPYNYIVVANYKEKPGLSSTVLTATPAIIAPVAPIQMTYTRGTAGITLQWPILKGETYDIFWSGNPGVNENSTVYASQLPPFTFPTDNANASIYFRLQASNGQSNSSKGPLSFEAMVPAGVQNSETNLSSTLSPPSAPLAATIGFNDHQLSLNWAQDDTEVLYYNIYFSIGTSGVGKSDRIIPYLLPPYTHTPLTNNETVYYRIAAVSIGGEGPLSAEIFLAPQKPIPGVPGNVVTLAGDTWVGISWANVTAAEKYIVYWWQDGDTSPQSLDNTTSPTQIESLVIGQDYSVSVQAYNRDGIPSTSITEALMNNAQRVRTKGVLPTAPLQLIATPGNKQMELSWQASGAAGSTSGYRIYGVQGTDVKRHSNLLLGETAEQRFSHDGLTNRQSYSYLVSAINAFGESIGSVTVSAIAQTPIPAAPQDVSALAGDGYVSIDWTEDDGILQYNVYRIAPDDSKTVFANVSAPTTITATNGVDYRFYVSAISSAGQEGIESIIVSATPAVTPPTEAPANIVIVANKGSNQLSWQGVTSADAGYRVYISRQGEIDSSSSNFIEIDANNGTRFEHIYTYSGDGFFYSYAISAMSSGGEGPLSTVQMASAPKRALPQSPPTDFNISNGDAEVVFSWTEVADADSYTIYWSNNVEESNLLNWFSIAGVRPGDKHQSLSNDTTYYYQLAAVNSSGESTTLSAASGTPALPLPPAPTGLQAIAGDSLVNLSWPQQSGSSYQLYWSTAPFSDSTTATLITNVDSVYKLSSLINNNTYYFRLAAQNVTGEGALSAQVSATPQATGGGNQPPVITGQNSLSTAFETPITVILQDLQVNPNSDTLILTISNADSGDYTLSNNTVIPTANFSGSLSVLATVFDGSLNSDFFEVFITVLPPTMNLAPQILGQLSTLNTPSATAITLKLGDLDTLDANNDVLNLRLLPMDTGDYSFTGTTVTPSAQFNGLLSVPVVVNDGQLDSASFTMSITVLAPGVNTPPRFITTLPPITASMPEDGTKQWTLFATDDDNDPITWSVFTLAENGLLEVLNNDGTDTSRIVQYTPAANYFGIESFVVRIADGISGSADFAFTINVDPINDPPTLFFPPSGVLDNTAVVGQLFSIDIEIQDIDSNSADLHWNSAAITVPAWATFTQTSNNTARLNGIASTAGTYPVTLDWADSVAVGSNVSMNFDIVVSDAPPVANIDAIVATGFGDFESSFNGIKQDYSRTMTSWDSTTAVTTIDRYNWVTATTATWQLDTINTPNTVLLGTDGNWARILDNLYVEGTDPLTTTVTLAQRASNNGLITYGRFDATVHAVIPLQAQKLNSYLEPALQLAVPDQTVFSAGAEAYGIQFSFLENVYEIDCSALATPVGDTCSAVAPMRPDLSVAPYASQISAVFNTSGNAAAGPFVFVDYDAQGQQYYVELLATDIAARTGTANYYLLDNFEILNDLQISGTWSIDTVTGTVGAMASVELLVYTLPDSIFNATDSSLDQRNRILTVWNSGGTNNYLRYGINGTPGLIVDPRLPSALYLIYNPIAATDIATNFNPGSGIIAFDANDRDGDGVANEFDAFPDDPSRDTDTDGDGIADVAYYVAESGKRLAEIFPALSDPDDDGDLIPDYADSCPLTAQANNDPSVCNTDAIIGVYKNSQTKIVDATGTSGVFVGQCFPEELANPSVQEYIDVIPSRSGTILVNGDVPLSYHAGNLALTGNFTNTYIDSIFSPGQSSYVDVPVTTTTSVTLTYDPVLQNFTGTSSESRTAMLDANNQLNCNLTANISAQWTYRHTGQENYSGLYGMEYSELEFGKNRRDVDTIQIDVDTIKQKANIYWIDAITPQEQIVLDEVSSRFDATQGTFLNSYTRHSILGNIETGQNVLCEKSTQRGLFVADPLNPGTDNVMLYVREKIKKKNFQNTTDTNLCFSNTTVGNQFEGEFSNYGKLITSNSFTRTVRTFDTNLGTIDKIRIGMSNPPLMRPTDTRNLWLQVLNSQGTELCSRPFKNDGVKPAGYIKNTRLVKPDQSSIDPNTLEFQTTPYGIITCNTSLADGSDTLTAGESYTARILDPGANNSKETTGLTLAADESVVGLPITATATIVSLIDRFTVIPDRLSFDLNGATLATANGAITPLYGFFDPRKSLLLSWAALPAGNVRNYQIRVEDGLNRFRFDTANNQTATSYTLPPGALPANNIVLLRITATQSDVLNSLAFAHSQRVDIKPGLRGPLTVTTNAPANFEVFVEADIYGKVQSCQESSGRYLCLAGISTWDMASAILTLSIDDTLGDMTGVPRTRFTTIVTFTDSANGGAVITVSPTVSYTGQASFNTPQGF